MLSATGGPGDPADLGAGGGLVAGTPEPVAHKWRLFALLGIAALASVIAVVLAARQAPAEATGSVVLTDVDTEGIAGLYTSLELDAIGRPVISYVADERLNVVHCGNVSCTAGNTFATFNEISQVTWTSLEIDSFGNPVVAFTGNAYPFGANLFLLRCSNPSCIGDNSIATPDPEMIGHTRPSLALDSRDNPVVSYRGISPAGGTLRIVRCGDPTCTSGNSIVDADLYGDPGYNSSIALDDQGFPVVAYEGLDYLDANANEIRLLRCSDQACSEPQSIVTLDLAAPVGCACFGGLPALALDNDGLPAISYYQLGPMTTLRVVRCTDSACSGGRSTAIVERVNYSKVGNSTLALNKSGNPVVTFYSEGGGSPRLLRCGNSQCTSENTIANLESSIMQGTYASLALDASDSPVVSYFVLPGVGLRVAHCADETCKGITVPTPTPCPDGMVPVTAGCAAPTPARTFEPTVPPTRTLPPAPDFSIAIDRNGDGVDDCHTGTGGATTCSIAEGSTFRVKVYLNRLPPGSFSGFLGFDAFLMYESLTFKNAVDSTHWPPCGFPAQVNLGYGVRLGCAADFGESPSMYTGLLSTVPFTCTSDGSITLVHGDTDTTLDGVYYENPSIVESLTINCLPPLQGCADTTGDGTVRVGDVIAIVQRYGVDLGEPLFEPRFDLNTDTHIRIADILMAIAQYGTQCVQGS
jgi:hypothetical protein